MFKKLLARLFGSVRERVEAEEAYEKEFGKPPMRGMSTYHVKRRVQQAEVARRSKPTLDPFWRGRAAGYEAGEKPMAVRRRHSPQPLVQDDPLLNPLHPASPINPAYHQPMTSSHRSHSSCDDSSSRHYGDTHHSSSSYDSGSSDSGSSSSGGCD